MADYTHENLQLVGRHVPDPLAAGFENPGQAQAAGYDTMHPVTGTYEIGVIIEGAFVPLITEKASLIFDRIELAAQSQPPADQNEPVSTGPQAEPTPGEPASSEQPQG